MDTSKLDDHKKVLGILYVVSAALTIIGMLFVNALLTFIFSFALKDAGADDKEVVETLLSILQYLPGIVIIFVSIPTLIAGIGLLSKQGWAPVFAMIMGCLKLFSFPIGTAIGIYAIWVYSEDQKSKRLAK